jgi:hypothetical protein
MTEPTYGHVEVELIGTDGNAMALIHKVSSALRRGVGIEAAGDFRAAAFQADSYDDLLNLIMDTVES